MIGYMHPDKPEVWTMPKAKRMIGKIMKAGHPVVLTAGPGSANIIFTLEDWTPQRVIDEIVVSANQDAVVVT
jgi:hypothetical protein